MNQKELKNLLQYNKDTGNFIWVVSPAFNVKAGSKAGTLRKDGRIQIRINKKTYEAHRLVWIYNYNEIPKIIDHIDGNPSNNKLENLRNVSHRINSQNTLKHRNGKLVGATFNKKTNKWTSKIYVNNKTKFLGNYNTEIEAHQAYLIEVKQLCVGK